MGMRVRLACQPLTWRNFAEAIGDIAEIGYDGIEAPVVAFLDRIDELKALLDEHKLACSATYVGGQFWKGWTEEAERAVKIAEALPKLGCSILIVASAGYSPRPGKAPKRHYQRFCETVNEIARRVKNFGVKVVLHNHAWTLIESAEEVDIFMDKTDPELVWAGFDTAHLAYGDADPVATFRKYKDRIGYIHLKDLNPQLDGITLEQRYQLGRVKHVFWELGQGAIGERLSGVLDVLREIKYDGWICVELDSTPSLPRVANANNYMWLVKHLKPGERASF